MRIVLDTNVLVSGLLTEHGNPGFILRLVLEGEIEFALDERILAEYRAVLGRPKFGVARETQLALLKELQAIAVLSGLPKQAVRLPDPDDQRFLEVALAASADAIVTCNTKHFPADKCEPVRVITPAGLVQLWSELNA